MKDIILKYVTDKFGEKSSEQKNTHFSYCRFPEEKCICKRLKEIDYDTSLITGGYIDSFSLISIIVYLQKTFNVKIPEKESTVNNLDTINKMADLITKLKQ
jgi:acyl carrier protein